MILFLTEHVALIIFSGSIDCERLVVVKHANTFYLNRKFATVHLSLNVHFQNFPKLGSVQMIITLPK